jgi:hypothetical protein
MPGGRSPLDHHAFPILPPAQHAAAAAAQPPPTGAVQPFVDVFRMMKCEGWNLGIDIAVASDRTAPQLGGRARAASGAAGGLASPGGSPAAVRLPGASRFFRPLRVPHVYIGEFQVRTVVT